MGFKELIERERNLRRSSLILALDLVGEDKAELIKKSKQLISEVTAHLCAVKFGRPIVLSLALQNGVKELVAHCHSLGLPTIMDAKINDIGNTNMLLAKQYFAAGFDAITANPFIGWKDGLEPVFSFAHSQSKGVLTLVYMSHGGAKEGFGQIIANSRTRRKRLQYEVFAEKALRWDADGVIVGGTRPSIIRRVRAIIGREIPIYSPGIGAQGGDAVMATKAGADYLIVGRSLYESKNPRKSAMELSQAIYPYLKAKI